MAFIVNSTSTITPSVERVCRVMQRARIAKSIAYGGVFSCRKIDGSSSWSQHAWGNAVDLFPKGTEYAEKRARCYKIANAVAYQAKHRTKANNLRKLDVAEVIDHENGRIWTPAGGWGPYGGGIGLHVHVTGGSEEGRRAGLRLMNERSPVHDNNGGTVPLRQYIEAMIAERDKAVNEAMRQMELRLAQLNELRSEVSKDRNLFLTRDKYEGEIRALEDRVDALATRAVEDEAKHVSTEKYQADLSGLKAEVRALDKKAASQDAVNAYKRLMYAAIGTGLLAFGIAFFNLVTKGGA